MNGPRDPDETENISKAPVDSLDAGLAAGFGRPAQGPTSGRASLRNSFGTMPPVLLREAEGDSGHVVRPKSDAMPRPAETHSRYQLAGEIARGGMGAVLRGRDVELGRELAVKVLLEKYVNHPEIARRFIEEAQIGGQLQHPGIVPVYDIGSFGDRPFFTMKLVKGRTLASILGDRTEPAEDRPRLLAIALQVTQTLAYAHAKGVIHRDLKPANIMVGAFGEVQVMDWGLAKVLADGGVADEEQASRALRPPGGEPTVIRTARSGSAGSGVTDTEAGSLLGTPAYMAPEQANGEIEHLDRRADVFGVGALLCEILTGKPPYVGRSADEVRRKAANGDLADTHARLDACDADPELIVLVTDCLAPEAIDRPKDAQAVTTALTAYLDGVQERLHQAELDRAAAIARTEEEVNTRRMAEAKTVEERKRRHTQLALAAAVVALFGLAGGGLWWQQQQRAAAQAERSTRQAGTAASIAESLVDARQRIAEAWKATSFPDRMRVATEAAEAAVRRADGYAAGDEVTRESRAELAAIRPPLADLIRHNRLVVDYDWNLSQFFKWDEDELGGLFDTHVRRHEAAIRRFGLDPWKTPEDEVAQAIVADRLRDALIAIFSTWQIHVKDPAAKDRLGRVIRLTRLKCGGAYARWQDLLDRNDMKGLAAFAGSLEMLQLGPDLVNALARDLVTKAQDYEASRTLLRAAADRYPDAIVIHFDLAIACREMTPPQNIEALRHWAALIALKPDAPLFYYWLGCTYSDLGADEQAILAHRKAMELGSVISALALGRLFLQGGHLDESIAAFRQAVSLVRKTALAVPRYTSAAEGELRMVLRLRELQETLPGLLKGEVKPVSAQESVEIAQLLTYKQKFSEAMRFYIGAFELEPKLADGVGGHRYNAACCAARAAADTGNDSASIDGKERTRMRQHALNWLRAELAEMTRQKTGAKAKDRAALLYLMKHSQRDRDLASIRDKEALAKLPAEEREAFTKLWGEFKALIKSADENPN
jgi:serine/threonine protein kinase